MFSVHGPDRIGLLFALHVLRCPISSAPKGTPSPKFPGKHEPVTRRFNFLFANNITPKQDEKKKVGRRDGNENTDPTSARSVLCTNPINPTSLLTSNKAKTFFVLFCFSWHFSFFQCWLLRGSNSNVAEETWAVI